jgi:hypothetical protein
MVVVRPVGLVLGEAKAGSAVAHEKAGHSYWVEKIEEVAGD